MNREERLESFARHVLSDTTLQSLVAELRELRDAGFSAQEVELMLNDLRLNGNDSLREDRVLEVLDYVTGFCRIENTVWQKE